MDFSELRDDFLMIVTDVVWATMATVDTRGRPRTRVVHPYWEEVDGRPVGWSPKHETAHVECRASWADDQRERVWQLFLDADPPLGYDPASIPQWKEGPLAGEFAALRLDPWRLMILTAKDAAEGRRYQRVWRG